MNWYKKSQLLGRFRRLNNAEKVRIYEFRDNPTPAEVKLWEILRNKQLNGYKFRRQHKIGQFIVNFYCYNTSLVIEVDGAVHLKRKVEDKIREEWLSSLGLRILRFTNEEVLKNLNDVRKRIQQVLERINNS